VLLVFEGQIIDLEGLDTGDRSILSGIGARNTLQKYKSIVEYRRATDFYHDEVLEQAKIHAIESTSFIGSTGSLVERKKRLI